MLTIEISNEVSDRTALAALMYVPDAVLHADVLSLTSHVEFVLENVTGVSDDLLGQLRDIVAATIADPTGHREIFYRFITDNTLEDVAAS